MNRITLLAGAALFAAAFGTASMGWAQQTSPAVMQSDASGAVTFGGETLLRIRTGAGGFTAAQRAEAVKDRLVPILSLESLAPSEITIRQTRPRQDASIYVRDRLLITVDRTLAQANGNGDPGALAMAWAAHLRSILPNVTVRENPAGP